MTRTTGKRIRKNLISLTTIPALLVVLLSDVVDLQAQAGEPSDVNQGRRIERLGDTTVDEWEMDLSVPPAASGITSGEIPESLPDEEQNRHLQDVLSRLAKDPGNQAALGQLDDLLANVLQQATGMIDSGFPEQGEPLLRLIQSMNPGLTGLDEAQQHLQALKDSAELVAAGNLALQEMHIIEPDRNNAFYFYTQAKLKDPTASAAQSGLAQVQGLLIQRALESATELDFDLADEWLREAAKVLEDQTRVDSARQQLARFHQKYAQALEHKALQAMDSGNFDQAELSIIDLIALGGQTDRVDSLRARLEESRFYGGFEPGQIITDPFLRAGHQAPEIVIIAAGSFLMGTTGSIKGSRDNERPAHRVTIARGFGIGAREVSVGEFRLFVESNGYRTAVERAGSSTIYDESAGRLNRRKGVSWEDGYTGKKSKPNMPVLHVNWFDAQAYVKWLSLETGKRYRLPSEAEYEYVARAGAIGNYWWGENSPPEVVENLTGERDSSPGKRQWSNYFSRYGDAHWGPAPTGSFPPNPFGVHDIAGNVSEWTEDCWHHNYTKAPVDGLAWVNPGCKRRVVRGGYWASAPLDSRAAFRISAKAETFGPVVGIRIARDL